jgi:hypothetical protein
MLAAGRPGLADGEQSCVLPKLDEHLAPIARRFLRCLTAGRRRMGTSRLIAQFSIAIRPTSEPFVANIRMNPEPSAQLTSVRSLLHRKPYKLTPLIHDRNLLPPHGWPPCSRIHAMMKCRSCPRLNIKPGGPSCRSAYRSPAANPSEPPLRMDCRAKGRSRPSSTGYARQ